ncbi:hypothetical protein GCM10028820_06070 [Tessaracoccus terricola]
MRGWFQRRPKYSLELHKQVWCRLEAGQPVESIAAEFGVSKSWMWLLHKQAGDMFKRVRQYSGRYLGMAERFEIGELFHAGHGIRQIARMMGRCPSTISRELRRNAAAGSAGPGLRYVPWEAHRQAVVRQARPKERKLQQRPRLRRVVRAGLDENWSPEQISGRLKVDFPDDGDMRISPESIYQAIYVKPVGGLERLLKADLRSRRSERRRQGRQHRKGKTIPDLVSIHERPVDVETRQVPGHHEGDLIVGSTESSSAIATVVERVTGYTTLVHLPQGRNTAHVVAQLTAAMNQYPPAFLKSVTWDRGNEMSSHKNLTKATGLEVYFADPYCPWQRGTNENTNGLLRQYFPKGTDLSIHSADYLQFVQDQLNDRPRTTRLPHTP